jgi:hypothetical protein
MRIGRAKHQAAKARKVVSREAIVLADGKKGSPITGS